MDVHTARELLACEPGAGAEALNGRTAARRSRPTRTRAATRAPSSAPPRRTRRSRPRAPRRATRLRATPRAGRAAARTSAPRGRVPRVRRGGGGGGAPSLRARRSPRRRGARNDLGGLSRPEDAPRRPRRAPRPARPRADARRSPCRQRPPPTPTTPAAAAAAAAPARRWHRASPPPPPDDAAEQAGGAFADALCGSFGFVDCATLRAEIARDDACVVDARAAAADGARARRGARAVARALRRRGRARAAEELEGGVQAAGHAWQCRGRSCASSCTRGGPRPRRPPRRRAARGAVRARLRVAARRACAVPARPQRLEGGSSRGSGRTPRAGCCARRRRRRRRRRERRGRPRARRGQRGALNPFARCCSSESGGATWRSSPSTARAARRGAARARRRLGERRRPMRRRHSLSRAAAAAAAYNARRVAVQARADARAREGGRGRGAAPDVPTLAVLAGPCASTTDTTSARAARWRRAPTSVAVGRRAPAGDDRARSEGVRAPNCGTVRVRQPAFGGWVSKKCLIFIEARDGAATAVVPARCADARTATRRSGPIVSVTEARARRAWTAGNYNP